MDSSSFSLQLPAGLELVINVKLATSTDSTVDILMLCSYCATEARPNTTTAIQQFLIDTEHNDSQERRPNVRHTLQAILVFCNYRQKCLIA